jgi:hypothetical protein
MFYLVFDFNHQPSAFTSGVMAREDGSLIVEGKAVNHSSKEKKPCSN